MADKHLKPGAILRLWRQHKGLTLERAAQLIADVAREADVPENSKAVPRTHASLIRWETDQVQMKHLGLELIAAAYGEPAERLRKPPPREDEPATEAVDVPTAQADAVRAFMDALHKRAG